MAAKSTEQAAIAATAPTPNPSEVAPTDLASPVLIGR